MDGALGPRTAAMFQPYLNEPENRGTLNMDGEQLFELGRHAADVGLGMTVHAIGDRANHEVLKRIRAIARLMKRKRDYPLCATASNMSRFFIPMMRRVLPNSMWLLRCSPSMPHPIC